MSQHTYDSKAMVFLLQSSVGHAPIIRKVKSQHAKHALVSCTAEHYMYFGYYAFRINGAKKTVEIQRQACQYEEFPTDFHLLGGNAESNVIEIEVYRVV